MPRISEFFGIVISMYYDDHRPPHFHARYGENEAAMIIETAVVLYGAIPPRALRLVREWATLHRPELVANWESARVGRPVQPIAALE